MTLFTNFLATSPLVEGKTISDFYDKSKQYDTFISVSKHQIESVYNEKINFNFLEQTPPSQNLKPVYTYACGLMSWEVKTYLSNYKELGKAGYHGGRGTRGFMNYQQLNLSMLIILKTLHLQS